MNEPLNTMGIGMRQHPTIDDHRTCRVGFDRTDAPVTHDFQVADTSRAFCGGYLVLFCTRCSLTIQTTVKAMRSCP